MKKKIKKTGEGFKNKIIEFISKNPTKKPERIEPPILTPKHRTVREIMEIRKEIGRV